jgi:hypothetical protein
MVARLLSADASFRLSGANVRYIAIARCTASSAFSSSPRLRSSRL